MTPEAQQDTSTPGAELRYALRALTDRLGHPLSDADLDRVFAGKPGTYEVTDAVAALEHAGFVADYGKLALGKLDPALLPMLVFDKAGAPLLILAREDAGRFSVLDPETNAPRVMTLQDLKPRRIRYGLRVRPGLARTGGDTDEAKGGHWFWSSFRNLKGIYLQVILAAAIANVLGLTTSIFTMVVYDRILPNEAIDSLFALVAGVGIALGFDFLVKSLRSAFIDSAGRRADQRMAEKLFQHVLSMKMAARNKSVGHMTSVMKDFEVVREFFTSASMVALVDLPFVALFILVIWMIGGPLYLIPAIAVPVVLAIALIAQPLMRRHMLNSSHDGQSKQGVLVETLTGMDTLKSVGAESLVRSRWNAAVKTQADNAGKGRRVAQSTINLTTFIQQACQVLIVFYGVFLVSAGQVSMGALIACVILTGKTLAPLAQVSSVMTRATQAIIAYRQINEVMETRTEREVGKRYLPLAKLSGKIELEDASFAYSDEIGDVLSDLSIAIQPGERVAIMGPVGSGKSTVARMLLGLAEPTGGRVLLDGLDARAIDPADRIRNIGAVLQEPWLFSGTVRENIVAGRYGVADTEVLEKAQLACVDEIVARHPHGYDLTLREGGQGISGGQRQCISLARALIGDPNVLVLDEPTAAMDVRTEARVISNLDTYLGADDARTLVLVTHRTSLLKLVDRVIILERGRVAYDGPKEQMLKRPSKPRSASVA
ncbi:type I secretion system permease/ATPase [Shimia ponticola]|uniref:type I secretion system permease/ATPase n=1 Tax=Shimia ponticola TaxID=2582893 RepID=UPI0011BF6C17|nr:type I secretion system permease/ATPase [Shimia ponticola]